MSSTLVKKLKKLAKDVKSLPITRIPNDLDKATLIVCNTYTSARLSLGDGPMNDAITFATSMKAFGFTQYYLHNPVSRTFLNYLDAFFRKTKGHLVVYYVGHGTTVYDTSGDEDDKYDEAFVFEDGVMIDDTLIKHLISNKASSSRITLVTDACHSGSIWDIQSKSNLPKNLISIAAANDKQTAKQTIIDRKEQGIFTMNFGKALKSNPKLTPKQLVTELKTPLKKYSQTCVVVTTSKDLASKPLFEKST